MTIVYITLFQLFITVLAWWALNKVATKPIKVEIVCGEQIVTSYLTPIDNTIRINLHAEE
jgi:hypothetical protein